MSKSKDLSAHTGADAYVVKTSIFLTDMGKFSEVNEIYGKYFQGDFPARETIQVAALPRYVSVEISMIAVG